MLDVYILIFNPSFVHLNRIKAILELVLNWPILVGTILAYHFITC